MKFLKRSAVFILVLAVFAGLYAVCEYLGVNARSFYMDTPGKTAEGSIDFSKTSVDRLVEQYVNNEIERDIIVTATGDMKFYEWQLNRAYNQETKTFDFSPSFAYVSKYFETSDYVIGDIETTLAGSGNGTQTSYNGYGADRQTKSYNTPEVLAGNLQAAGFDLITTANEHALDSQAAGLTSTIHYLTEAGLKVSGTRSDATQPSYIIEDIRGMKTGFIAYTNVLTNTEDEAAVSLVNYLAAYDEDRIGELCSQIAAMRREGAEAVIVQLHFGTEYAVMPEEQDKALANRLIQAGADVILGSHTHVPGAIEVVDVAGEDGSSRKGLIVYSMGNFLTSQQYVDGSGNYRDMGMICDIIFKKGKNSVRIGGLYLTPVYSNWTDTEIATIPVMEAHDAPDQFGDIFDRLAKARINAAYDTIFPELMQSCGLTYSYEDYKYKISIEN